MISCGIAPQTNCLSDRTVENIVIPLACLTVFWPLLKHSSRTAFNYAYRCFEISELWTRLWLVYHVCDMTMLCKYGGDRRGCCHSGKGWRSWGLPKTPANTNKVEIANFNTLIYQSNILVGLRFIPGIHCGRAVHSQGSLYMYKLLPCGQRQIMIKFTQGNQLS